MKEVDGLGIEQQAAIEQLKLLVEESDQAVLSPPCEMACPGCSGSSPISTRTMTDEQLLAFLAANDGNLRKTAYQVLLYKSKPSDITLSSGLRLPDQSRYYLRLASLYRTNQGGMLHRADDPGREQID